MAPSLSKNVLYAIGLLDSQIPPSISLEGSNFLANGHPIFTQVPVNIIATPSPYTSANKTKHTAGCFVGFDADESGDRHVVPIGKLNGIKFMSIFRFKVWWTTHWVGKSGKDMEHETQLMILDKNDMGRPYALLLPILEGSFRASLQPGTDNYVDMCVESGSSQVRGSSFRSCLYMHVGDDPYSLVKEAMKVVRVHLGTFKLLEEKTVPGIVDKFGWCTWDAFYLQVHPKGVYEGVEGLVEGGCPPGLVLIDDGWQSICHDDEPITDQEGMNRTSAGEQMPCRLIDFEENYKFRDYKSPRVPSKKGMSAFVRDLKDEFKSVDHVYVWHALCGYWGGIRPNAAGMPESRLIAPKLSQGLQTTMEDLAVDKIVDNGIGLVPPELVQNLYEGLHSHLESVGIDGVKVDVIHDKYNNIYLWELNVRERCDEMTKTTACVIVNEIAGYNATYVKEIPCHLTVMARVNSVSCLLAYHPWLLEMVAEDFGGRVELAKAYYKALTASVRKHFKGNGVIASMEHCNDFIYLGTETISLGRVGDDFWCSDPKGVTNGTFWLQGCHMVHCAYNSLWMGNVIQPDWDMFQSTHPCAEFHAASRAISGGPIYISDSVGNHNFDLLKALVLPDGSILRCQFYALPTRDCLFEDPLHDGKTVLKIWNLNKHTGVLGLFNCQGGGWCSVTRKNVGFSMFSNTLTCLASPNDIEWNNGKDPISVKGVDAFAVYMFRENKLKLLKFSDDLEVTVQPFNFELLTVSLVTVLPKRSIQFAPIGLVNMLNTGGAVQSLALDDDENLVRIGVKGCGEMKVFASEKPLMCKVDGVGVEFSYEDRMAMVQVPWPNNSSKFTVVDYLFE